VLPNKILKLELTIHLIFICDIQILWCTSILTKKKISWKRSFSIFASGKKC